MNRVLGIFVSVLSLLSGSALSQPLTIQADSDCFMTDGFLFELKNTTSDVDFHLTGSFDLYAKSGNHTLKVFSNPANCASFGTSFDIDSNWTQLGVDTSFSGLSENNSDGPVTPLTIDVQGSMVLEPGQVYSLALFIESDGKNSLYGNDVTGVTSPDGLAYVPGHSFQTIAEEGEQYKIGTFSGTGGPQGAIHYTTSPIPEPSSGLVLLVGLLVHRKRKSPIAFSTR